MNSYFIILYVFAVLCFSSCDHVTTCKIPSPAFDSLTVNLKTYANYQYIKSTKYDPLATHIWYGISTPISNQKILISQGSSPTLKYTFDREGIYKFGLVSTKYECYSDTLVLTVNSSKNNSGGGSGPCLLPVGNDFKLLNTYYTATNTPNLTTTSNYAYTGLYDNGGNNVYFYLPKTFSNSPIIGDYTINGTKSYTQLSGTECAIEIKGTRYAAVNPITARVHILQGNTKTIELSVCNFQYLFNGNIYTLEAKFEF